MLILVEDDHGMKRLQILMLNLKFELSSQHC